MDNRFAPLFGKYNKILKPLVAQIEGRFEKFETPLLVNLMDFWECVVQMHVSGKECEAALMQKADEKLDESISQSYVYMIVISVLAGVYVKTIVNWLQQWL